MISDTSMEAYKSILYGLGERQQVVYDMFKDIGFASNREISVALDVPINQITPRTNELVKSGLVVRRGKKLDHKTKRNVIVWGIVK